MKLNEVAVQDAIAKMRNGSCSSVELVSSCLDQVGIFSKNVGDSALLASVLMGREESQRKGERLSAIEGCSTD